MKNYDFKDINLIPQKGIVDSRNECDTWVQFGDYQFLLPVVPANMQSVINEELAIKLAKEGYFYIMHRFEIDTLKFIRTMTKNGLLSSISLGVNKDSYDLVDKMEAESVIPHYITIDIAHGHCIKMEKMIKYIKEKLPRVFIIAGNISTEQAARDLEQWGANAIKVGIAPGMSCTTAYMTGFGSRDCQASTIKECSRSTFLPVIADGGIKYPADIAKALVMGATMVMCGSLVTGCTDSPGELKNVNGELVKEYWGSASQYQSGKSNRIEGKMTLIPYKNKTLLEQFWFLKECLQSAISYAGGKDLKSFNKTEYKILN